MRPHASISTSEIHFIISKTVSVVRADATEVTMSKHKSSSTNGLRATVENQKTIFLKKFLSASITTRKIRWIHWWNPFLNPLTIKRDICNFVVNMSDLALCLCDRRVWSFQYVATERLQVGAFIGDAILGRYFALGNTCPVHLSSCPCGWSVCC